MNPLKTAVIISGLLLLAVIINSIAVKYATQTKPKAPTACWVQTIPDISMYHREPCGVTIHYLGDTHEH